MVICAPADEAKTISFHPIGKGLGIIEDLLLVSLKRGLQALEQADRLGGDHVHQRATLDARERLGIDLAGVLFLAKNQTPTRAAQSLVGSGGDEIRKRNRTGMKPRGDKS